MLLSKVETEYALLVDTDVVFLRSPEAAFDQVKEMNLTLAGEVCGDRGGKSLHPRIVPWFCFINVKNIQEKDIKFFDKTRLELQENKRYDVGSSFLEDIRKSKLGIGSIKGENFYYRHYEGMSWRMQKFGDTDGNIDIDNQATHTNQRLREHGFQVLNQYLFDTKCLEDMSMNYEPA